MLKKTTALQLTESAENIQHIGIHLTPNNTEYTQNKARFNPYLKLYWLTQRNTNNKLFWFDFNRYLKAWLWFKCSIILEQYIFDQQQFYTFFILNNDYVSQYSSFPCMVIFSYSVCGCAKIIWGRNAVRGITGNKHIPSSVTSTQRTMLKES